MGLEAARGLVGFCPDVVVLDAKTETFLGEDKVTGARLKGGREFEAHTVLIAAGVRPNARLAVASGLDIERGIVVNNRMQTSQPDVYASGDVASYKNYSWAIALIAQAQARVAAANMANGDMVYDVVVPSTTFKVVGIDVTSVGVVNPDQADFVEIKQQDGAAGTYKKIVLHNGVSVGCIIKLNGPVTGRLV